MSDDPLVCKPGPFGIDRPDGMRTEAKPARTGPLFDPGTPAPPMFGTSAWTLPLSGSPTGFAGSMDLGFPDRRFFFGPKQDAWTFAMPPRISENGLKVVRTTRAELRTLTKGYKPNAELIDILSDDTAGLMWFHHINRWPLRLCHFLAQMAHESTRFSQLRELLGYSSAARIVAVFGPGKHSAKVTLEEAEALTGKPEALGERVYGLGNPKKAKEFDHAVAGEGFKYRGRGLIHLTGKANYKVYGDHPDVQLNLVGDPEIAAQPLPALKIAVAFWKDHGLDALADADKVAAITKKINGGTNGLGDRTKLLETAKHLWGNREPS